MFKFVDVVGYTTSKSDKPVILNGIFDLTDTFRCGRTKVQELDGNTYWIDSSLDQVGMYGWNPSDTADDFNDAEDEFSEHVEKVVEEQKPDSDQNNKQHKVPRLHIVRRGETVQSIAEMYGLSTQWLINHIGTSTVYVGQIITIFFEV